MGTRTHVMTAAKNPVQMDAVAARAPCRDEKKVPTRAGSAEPVKIPVIFCIGCIISIIRHRLMVGVRVGEHAYIDEAQINVDTVEHGSKGSHENSKARNAPMSRPKNLGISGVRLEIYEQGC
jgi:hypothetical protein